MSNTITCPSCKTEIEITEVMSAQLADKIRGDIESEMAPRRQALEAQAKELDKQQAEIEQAQKAVDDQVRQRVEAMQGTLLEKAKKLAADDMAVEIKDRDEQLTEVKAKLEAAKQSELDWRKKERQLSDREQQLKVQQEQMEENNRKELNAQRQQIEEKARKKAKEELAADVAERDQQVTELQEKLKETQENELSLRKKERELQQRVEELDLTVERKMGEERDKIRNETRKQADEEFRLKDAEKAKTIADLSKQIDEMKRKAEQGSQQAQGEVQELALEELLRQGFPTDSIEDVPKGIRGGDVIQRVKNTAGLNCGTILWESKRTKNWSNKWLVKLRQDQREAKAAVSILVSSVLPEDINHFAQVDGVWVCNWICAASVATALRSGLLQIAKAKQALEGQHGKMERVYNYLASTEFRNRVAGIAEAFIAMKMDLDQEKRAIQKQWGKREQQIEQALFSTTGMYGDFQGIIGDTLPEIESMNMLQLEARS